MKQTLLTMALTLALAWAADAAGAATPTTNDSVSIAAIDSTVNDELEAFSDTTSNDSALASPWDAWPEEEEQEWESTDLHSVLREVDTDSLHDIFFMLCALLVLFVIAPVAIIGIILYFAYKSRKQRIRLAEMAMQNGQQIPTDVMGGPMPSTDAVHDKGIRQLFIGAGLAFLLWVILGRLGLAIGCLVMLMGCGNLVIARRTRQKMQEKELYDRMFGGDKQQ